jgi:hypothetical protein
MEIMSVEWSVGNLPIYDVYWIEYYIGQTKKVSMELLNYYDDLVKLNSNGDSVDYLFESFNSDDDIVINNTIIRWSKVEPPMN